MASGRRSGDPKDLLLVDPSRPEATKRARKHLTKRQKDIFVQYGFSKALLSEVIGAGWDQADINNYVLYYNGQSGSISCSTCTRAGYEHEESHQHHHPNQAASTRRGTGGRTIRGAKRLDWSHQPTQMETIYRRTSRTRSRDATPGTKKNSWWAAQT